MNLGISSSLLAHAWLFKIQSKVEEISDQILIKKESSFVAKINGDKNFNWINQTFYVCAHMQVSIFAKLITAIRVDLLNEPRKW